MLGGDSVYAPLKLAPCFILISTSKSGDFEKFYRWDVILLCVIRFSVNLVGSSNIRYTQQCA